MTGCIVKVWFEADGETRRAAPRFEIIETEMPDFATFCEMVDADRLIGGAKLFTTNLGPGNGYAVVRRQPMAFRGAAVMRCELPIASYEDHTE